MKQEYDIDFFEKLHRGELTDEQKSEFFTALENNAELREEAKSYEAIFNGLQGLKQEAFLTEVMDWESGLASDNDTQSVSSNLEPKAKSASENSTAKIRKMGPLKVFASIAAALIPLFIIGQFLMQKQFSNSQLLEEYYQLPVSENLRGGEVGNDAAIANILNAIKVGEFQNAATLISEAKSEAEVNQDKLLIVETHNYVAQQKYDDASVILNRIQPKSESVRHEYEWLEALVLIGKNTTDTEIISALEKVANNADNPHELEAEQLLSDMQSFWRKKKN